MSIKYNNKVIAGKYKEQIIPFANTIDAGIAKIATQEEIDEGVDNTSIVTPVYLAQKQDKLTAGEGIEIDATNTISSKILPDKVTIVENDNKTISTVARKTVNENILFDWEGTEAEYQQALHNGEIEPDWYCYITDDELAVSYDDVLSRTLVNIAPDGVKVLGASNAYLTNDIYTDEIGYNQLLELKNSAIKIDGIDYVTANNVKKEIPYVLTHTGSKIVNAEYREFLTEFFNENGYTEYFTIDEENKNYTLPMGEIYGKLPNKDLSNLSEAGIDTIKNITGVNFGLFDTKISDHVLTYEESLGWALQGTYVYKEAITGERYGYPTFYEKCLEEYTNTTSTETVNNVTVKVHSNGHKFYDIADKASIDTYYTTYGVADFYGIDTVNERVFLPRNKWFIQFTDNTTDVNKFTDAGLPNITGTFALGDVVDTYTSYTNHLQYGDGAFYSDTQSTASYNEDGQSTKGNIPKFDASRSNTTYGNSDTVQPKSSAKLLYYCVGNVKSDLSWINIVKQVDDSVAEILNTKEDSVQEVLDTKQNSLDEMEEKRVSSNESINVTRNESITEIQTLSQDYIEQTRKWAIGTAEENVEGSAKFWAETAQLSVSEVLESLANKVDTNAGNFTAEGKSLIGSYGMPSDRYIDLTLGATGSTYTAPANGWFVCDLKAGATNFQVFIRNNNNGMTANSISPASSGQSAVIMPCKKGDVISVYYGSYNSVNIFRFIYAVGSEGEAQ